MNKSLTIAMVALVASAPVSQDAMAEGSSFPKIIETPTGAAPEGFAIGRGHNAYNGSIDGSIYKINLRTGEGEILVPADSTFEDCRKLGMRVDKRTNHLFVAGCIYGNAYVYDAADGTLIMEYQLSEPFTGVINDLAITKDAVYFTDSYNPNLYRLPLGAGGELPGDTDGVEVITLPSEFQLDFENDFCCGANGIVASPNGETLVVGHSILASLYRVDVGSGRVDLIEMDFPLDGFLDGIARRGRNLYIMTPTQPSAFDRIQVVKLSWNWFRSSQLVTFTDPDLDDVASGDFFGNSLYVNNARYSQFPVDAEYWVTKLRIR